MKYTKKLIASLTLFIVPALLLADTGQDAATRVERGAYIDTLKVTGSSVTGTAIFSASTTRADGTCFNNSATNIWVSSNTTTQHNQVHTNIAFGYPVLSSATFPLDGQMTGSVAFTCDIGVAACEVRCVEGRAAR